MKNIKILIASCLMLVCAANVSAQWRFGVEWNHTFMTKYYYDYKGFFESKETNFNGGMAGFLTAEYILPRKWTPYWMAISIQGKFGGGPFSNNTHLEFDYRLDDGGYLKSYNPGGLMIPIDIELKLLLSNTCRFYINGGVPNMINMTSDTPIYATGYEFGAGFEIAFFRIGYKNVNFNNTFISGNIGNKYNNLHTLTTSFIFNGNRFLKKKSCLKAY